MTLDTVVPALGGLEHTLVQQWILLYSQICPKDAPVDLFARNARISDTDKLPGRIVEKK